MPIPTILEPLSQKDIIYFILTDRFHEGTEDDRISSKKQAKDSAPYRYHSGNFAGIEQKIPYLVNLGITALWISPVYLSIGSFLGQEGYHGYWVMDFEKVDPHLLGPGTSPEADADGKARLARLVENLHQNGIKVILDMVVNHTGYHTGSYYRYKKQLPSHWFKKKEDWDLLGLPKLDHRLADVRDYFVNNIIDWIESTGIDAIRMDSVPHIDREFWYYFKAYVRGKYHNIFFLGEDLEYDEEEISKYQREHDFDSLFDFPLRHNIIDVMIRNEDIKPLADRLGMAAIASPRIGDPAVRHGVLDADTKYNNANRLVTVLDNHDLEKRIATWAKEYSGGNEDTAVKFIKYVLSFQFTTRGIPQIYYGTEIGMEGNQDKGGDTEVRKDMEWSLIDPETLEPYDRFTAAAQIYTHLKKLIEIRKNNEALCFGYLFTLHSDYDNYVFMREFRGNTLIIALNNSILPSLLTVDIADNSNIPCRIKKNLKDRRTLVNLIAKQEKAVYEDGIIILNTAGKTTSIFRLID